MLPVVRVGLVTLGWLCCTSGSPNIWSGGCAKVGAEEEVGLWEGRDVTGVVNVFVVLLEPTDKEPEVSYSGERSRVDEKVNRLSLTARL